MAKILLVEDNEMNRDMLSRRLERRGFTVLIAVDGSIGIAKARGDALKLKVIFFFVNTSGGVDGQHQFEIHRLRPGSRDGRHQQEAGCNSRSLVTDFHANP